MLLRPLPTAWEDLARRWRVEWLIITVVSGVLTLVLSLTSQSTGLQRFDYLLYDWHLNNLPPRTVSSDIVMIAIDDDSIAQLGRWPWSRDRHAQLLSHLHQAKAVALDMLFSEPQHDAALIQAMQAHGRVVLPAALASNANLQPIASLRAAAARIGVINIWPDSDGTVRSLVFRPTDTQGTQHDHLLLGLLDAGGDHSRATTLREQGGEKPRLISYVGVPGTFPFLSYADVLHGKVPDSVFANKYVLVGVWGTGLRDIFPTPRSQGVSMSGVEIMANALDSALNNLWIRSFSRWGEALLALVPVLLMCLMLRQYSPRHAFLGMVLVILFLFFLHWLCLTFLIVWVPISASLMGVGLCVPIWNWRVQDLSLAYIDQELRALRAQQPRVQLRTRYKDRFDQSLAARVVTLQHAIAQLRQAQYQREMTLRFLSHDMRAPQSAILTLAQLQREPDTALAQAALLARIEQYAKRTLALADGFVYLARAESADMQVHTLNLPDLLLDAMDALWAQAKQRHIHLQHGKLPESALIRGDQGLLTRALINLIDNAIKYSADHTRIDCRLWRSGSDWVVEVCDQGRGIATEKIPALFKPFARVDNRLADNPDGSGLGLAFVHTVAMRHGGSITAKSQPGQGSTFLLRLPAVARRA